MADSSRQRESIAVWTEEDVQDWMAELGYPQYGEQIKSEQLCVKRELLLICQKSIVSQVSYSVSWIMRV